MKDNEKKLPESVTLSDNRVVTKRKAKVRDLANAENQPKGKEYQAKYAMFAAQITIDGRQAVLEDVLDMYSDDMELIASMFVDEDDLKNA